MRDCQAVDGFGHTWSGFVGIDWSGAKGQFIAGIQLAMARPGTTVPEPFCRHKMTIGRGKML